MIYPLPRQLLVNEKLCNLADEEGAWVLEVDDEFKDDEDVKWLLSLFDKYSIEDVR